MIVSKCTTHPIEASMNQRVEYNVVEFSEEAKSAFRKSLEASFIGSEKKPDDRFAPRILSNNDPASNVPSVIKGEFLDCVSFDLSVAFITASGIQVLAEILSQLRQRGIKGRILTSTYLCFDDPDALRKLLEYPNIETRVYQGDLHAKGYFFNKRGISTIIIGSSNLTQTALTCNKEWNVLFRSFPTGDIAHKTKAEFEKRSYQQKWLAENAVANCSFSRSYLKAQMVQSTLLPQLAEAMNPPRRPSVCSQANSRQEENNSLERSTENSSWTHASRRHFPIRGFAAAFPT